MLRQSLRAGHKRPVLQAPTGFGKTVLAAHIVAGALWKENRVAFVAPMLNLIDQTFERFRENGIDPAHMGVTQGDHPWRRPHAPVQICSAQTLARRGFPEVDLAVVDECHLRFDVIDRWMAVQPEMIFVGLSATPWSAGMADYCSDLIVPTSISELIAVGKLSPFRVWRRRIRTSTACRRWPATITRGNFPSACASPRWLRTSSPLGSNADTISPRSASRSIVRMPGCSPNSSLQVGSASRTSTNRRRKPQGDRG